MQEDLVVRRSVGPLVHNRLIDRPLLQHSPCCRFDYRRRIDFRPNGDGCVGRARNGCRRELCAFDVAFGSFATGSGCQQVRPYPLCHRKRK
jgi:hypothetical protein